MLRLRNEIGSNNLHVIKHYLLATQKLTKVQVETTDDFATLWNILSG
jgi:hypothetical protein